MYLYLFIEKKIILLIFVIVLFTSGVFYCQKFELTTFGGYQLAGKFVTEQGDLSIKNGLNYGLIADITVRPDLQAEFWYGRLSSELNLKNKSDGIDSKLFDLDVHYFQAGGTYIEKLGKVRPFAAITLGAVYFNPLKENVDGDWRFTVSVGGGAKIFFTDHIGVRFQGRLIIPVFIEDASIYCTNGLCAIQVSGGTTILQADLTGGLIVAF